MSPRLLSLCITDSQRDLASMMLSLLMAVKLVCCPLWHDNVALDKVRKGSSLSLQDVDQLRWHMMRNVDNPPGIKTLPCLVQTLRTFPVNDIVKGQLNEFNTTKAPLFHCKV